MNAGIDNAAFKNGIDFGFGAESMCQPSTSPIGSS